MNIYNINIMQEDAICYILMHSNQDWQKLLGVSEIDEFVKWIWDEVAEYIETDPVNWIRAKVSEFLGN